MIHFIAEGYRGSATCLNLHSNRLYYEGISMRYGGSRDRFLIRVRNLGAPKNFMFIFL